MDSLYMPISKIINFDFNKQNIKTNHWRIFYKILTAFFCSTIIVFPSFGIKAKVKLFLTFMQKHFKSIFCKADYNLNTQ